MKNSLFKGKSTHTKIFTAITCAAIVLLLVFNMLLTYVGGQRLIFADMTPEGFYTLSDKMISSCDAILNAKDEEGNKRQIKFTFCADPDHLTSSKDMRSTYFMALALRNRYDNVTVETVNLSVDPNAVAMYKTTSRQTIKPTDVIISYGAKYRVLNAGSFWTQNYFSYNGEYKMVSVLASLTAINNPAVYFLTDHGETYYDPENPSSEMSVSTAYLAELLIDRGLKIKTLEISKVDEIPEDCALLIINDPTEDFLADEDQFDRFDYISDTEKIDRYLVNKSGSLIVNKDHERELPVLESFLAEWGIGFGNSLVKDQGNCLSDVGEEGTAILGVYDVDSIGGAYYGDYANLSSAPKMVISDTGYLYCTFGESDSSAESGSYSTSKTFSTFIDSSANAVAYEGAGSTVITSAEGKKSLAAMSTRTYLDGYTAEYTYSYVFCTNTKDFFSNEILGNASYANYDVMSSVVSGISRTDRYASIELGGLSANSPSYGGKQTLSTAMKDTSWKVYSADAKEVIETNSAMTESLKTTYTVIIMCVPAIVLILGIAVFIRRKYL